MQMQIKWRFWIVIGIESSPVFLNMKFASRISPVNHILPDFLVHILIRFGDPLSWFWICETADRYEWYVTFDAKHNLLLRVQSLFWKPVIFPIIFSLKLSPVSLDCFRPCQMDLALRHSVPYVTSKNALKGNNGKFQQWTGTRQITWRVVPSPEWMTSYWLQELKFRNLWKYSIKLLAYMYQIELNVHLYNQGGLLCWLAHLKTVLACFKLQMFITLFF
jgi:hypothetical protein